MFFFLSKILDVLLSPYTWALGLIALAIPWRRPRRRSSWKTRRAIGAIGLTVILFFSLEAVPSSLLYWLENETAPTYRPGTTYDAVVLLGGLVNEHVTEESGQPSYNDNVERLIMVHRLLVQGRAKLAIVTSSPEVTSVRRESGEARVIARQLEEWGIDPARIIIEEHARNTHENAVYSQRIARERGLEKVLIVTSAYHMKRAAECFAAVGMPVDTFPVDFRARAGVGFFEHSWFPRANYLGESANELREIAGLYIYRLRGYAIPTPRPARGAK